MRDTRAGPAAMIAIVGAGLTGLAIGHRLAARGITHRIFEAADRPGGVIRSERVEGRVLEWGPQRTRLVGRVRDLVGELEIREEVITAPPDLPLYIYRADRLRMVPFSMAEFFRTDLFGWAEKVRVLAEPFTRGASPEERVADFFTRKFGRAAYENLLGPLYGGLYASDPADMVVGLSLGQVLREFGIGRSMLLRLLRRGGRIAAPPACSFREGMQTLPNALYRHNWENMRMGTPVHRLERCNGSYLLETEQETLHAAAVVLTTPAAVAADLLQTAAPEAAARIQRLRYNPLAVVHLHAETELVGLGYQVSLAEKLSTRGVTWNDSLFGRDGVYTAYLGGAKAPEVVDRPDAELADLAVREFRQVTGYEARSLSVARERMPAWDHSWEALSGMELPPGLRIAANWQSRPGVPGRLAQAERLAHELAGSTGVDG